MYVPAELIDSLQSTSYIAVYRLQDQVSIGVNCVVQGHSRVKLDQTLELSATMRLHDHPTTKKLRGSASHPTWLVGARTLRLVYAVVAFVCATHLDTKQHN